MFGWGRTALASSPAAFPPGSAPRRRTSRSPTSPPAVKQCAPDVAQNLRARHCVIRKNDNGQACWVRAP
eukprot:COSAG01_NODE_4646_length_4853_cov_70.544594_4_plen_69_part_00